MQSVFQFLEAQPFFVIFGVVALGMALGKVDVKGVSLGAVVCILLVGLAVSIAAANGFGVTLELPDVLKSVFFNMFIFAAGVKIGPQFFSGLQRDGWHMVTIGLIVAALAPALSLFCAWLFDWPQGAAAGLLAGANNSSATFGAANSALQSRAQSASGDLDLVTGMLAASFALCYAVAEVQYVLFMRWLPRFAHFAPPKAAHEFEASIRATSAAPLPGTVEAGEIQPASVAVRAYRLSEQRPVGRTIGDIRTRAPRVAVERVRRGDHWLDLEGNTALAAGDEVVVSAPLAAHSKVREALGPELPDAEARTLMPVHTVDVVVTRREVVGRPLPDVLASAGPGLYPSTVFRAGAELPITAATLLRKGDVIRVAGTEPHIVKLGALVGSVVRATHNSDVLTLALGLLVGAALGAIPVPMFGVEITFGAAAVLVTGILFGWVKTRDPAFGGPLSEGARRLLEGLGLNVFTAVLAVNSGPAVYQVVADGPVLSLVTSCLIVSGAPAVVAWWFGRYVLKTNLALLMGAIAGARQCTASLHVAQDETRSAVPGIGYPVPLAVATVVLSIVGYFVAAFD